MTLQSLDMMRNTRDTFPDSKPTEELVRRSNTTVMGKKQAV